MEELCSRTLLGGNVMLEMELVYLVNTFRFTLHFYLSTMNILKMLPLCIGVNVSKVPRSIIDHRYEPVQR